MNTTNSVVVAAGLAHATDTRWLFSGVNLDLQRGECVVIVGLSGSGKSTLVRLLAGLEAPDRGSVSLHGKVGVVFQDAALFEFDGVSVSDNLTLANRGEHPDRWLAAVGLNRDVLDRRPTALSGGQRRRVAIARALAARPAALLYDEPTAGLDPDRSRSFVKLLGQLQVELGLTVIMVTHDPETLAGLATHIAVLAEQHIVQFGLAADVMAGDHPFLAGFRDGDKSGLL